MVGVLETYEKRKTREDISTEITNDLFTARARLSKNIHDNNKLTMDQLQKSVQRILDRLVIIRVTEDRGIIHVESLSKMMEVWKDTSIDKLVRILMRDPSKVFPFRAQACMGDF